MTTRDINFWSDTGKRFFASAVSSVYPALCISCFEPVSDESSYCPKCWKELDFIRDQVCSICGTPQVGDTHDIVCDHCQRRTPDCDKIRAAFAYGGTARRIVLGLKHGDRHEAALPMAHAMVRETSSHWHGGDFIVPVPLHWSRMFKRKFNQSALLGHHFSKHSGIPMIEALRRTKRTKQQKGMTREQRESNLKGSIVLRPRMESRISGKTVILIDDVVTSGSTLNTAAQVLKDHGARTVIGICFARVVLGWDRAI